MSARLKLKKLKKTLELVCTRCSIREADARHKEFEYHRLLKDNLQDIDAFAELYPCETYFGATEHLKYVVHKLADSITLKYSEQLAEFIQNQLATKTVLNKVSVVSVRLRAPALNTDHIKVDVRSML